MTSRRILGPDHPTATDASGFSAAIIGLEQGKFVRAASDAMPTARKALHNGHSQCVTMLQSLNPERMQSMFNRSIAMSRPNAPASHATVYHATAKDARTLARKLANAVRGFATRNGIAPSAVEYSVVR